jgi:hypothetical protein
MKTPTSDERPLLEDVRFALEMFVDYVILNVVAVHALSDFFNGAASVFAKSESVRTSPLRRP